MKYLLYVSILTILLSCNKEDTEIINEKDEIDSLNIINEDSLQLGVLENYFSKNPQIIIEVLDLLPNDATHRGYTFRPNSNIKITEIGGMIGESGTYNIQLYELDESIFKKTSLLFNDSIEIADTAKFIYMETDDLILSSEKRYLIRYFSLDHNSVLQAGRVMHDGMTFLTNNFPLEIGEISIEISYYTFAEKSEEGYRIVSEETNHFGGLLVGLLDFKYETIE